MHNAFCNRHGAKQNQATRTFRGHLGEELELLRLSTDYQKHAEKWTYENWLAKWAASKQLVIEKSRVEDLCVADKVKMFVKFEVAHAMPSKARGIQMYVNPWSQAIYGPTFTALQKAVTETFRRFKINDRTHITIASGMDAIELGDWMTQVMAHYKNPRFYERDGANWDSSQQLIHHELKKQVYGLFIKDPGFFDYYDACYKVQGSGMVRGSSNGPLQYILDGTVKSGHSDTSLGNGVVNACITYSACEELGLECDILVVGDDLIVVVEGDFDETALAAVEAQYGIVPEFRKFGLPHEVEFASGIWVEGSRGAYTYIPKPGRLMARLMWTVKPPSSKISKTNDFIHSVVAGHMKLCEDLPIIGEFLRANDRDGKLINLPGKTEYECKTKVTYDRDMVSQWFAIRYGVTSDEITEVEAFFRLNAGHVGLVRHHVLDKILAVDLAKLEDRFTPAIVLLAPSAPPKLQ